MKKTSLLALTASLGMLLASSAFAADCVIHYNRTACPGKETESYAKCDGKKECDKVEAADSEAACKALAVNACENTRLQITKSKVVTATFGGKSLGGNFCAADRADFNKCQ